MVRAFGDDGMRLQDGGGRGVACARRHLGGHLIGTVIRHSRRGEPPPLPVCPHRIPVIELAFLTRLMSRVGRATRQSVADSTTGRTVDLAVIVDLAEMEHLRAPRATNLRESHAHLRDRARRSCPARPPSGTFARSASTRDTKARARDLGLHLFRGRTDRLRDLAKRRHFSEDPSMRGFLRI
jgi:hypothetical protein